VEGTPVTVGVGGGLAGPGYSFMLSTDTAGLVWEAIVDAGAVPMGSVAWEHLRVWQGRPVPGKELTDEFNALEAGLWKTISLTKGCYIGQETIARLITYDNVKQQLWGVHLDGPVQPNTVLYKEGVKVGKLTSCVEAKEGSQHKYTGLAYIRRQAGGAGLEVEIEEGISGVVVDVPFLTRSLPQ
jgi:folate-binding protein YgfZ